MNNLIDEKIINLYTSQLISIKAVAKLLNVSEWMVNDRLLKANISLKSTSDLCSKYSFNKTFFTNPSTWSHDQAYFFGWLLSDGCIQKNNEIKIGVAECDVDILIKLKNIIEFTGPIHQVKRKSHRTIIMGKECNAQDVRVLSIANKELADFFRNLKINNNKTASLIFPTWLNNNLLPHFLKGFFEGDGSIKHYKNCYSIDIISTHTFCSDLRNILQNELNIFPHMRKADNSKIYRLSLCGNYQVLKFLNWIYQNKTYYLDRKFQKYLDFVRFLRLNKNIHTKTKIELLKSPI